LIGNIINTIGKFIAFYYTGSGTVFSEAMHSLADCANQSLLLIGVMRSLKPATQDFPYGYTSSRFVFALISAVGIFFLGCGASLYNGIHNLIDPEPIHDLWVGLLVIGFSSIIESFSFSRGVIATINGAHETNMGFIEYVKKGPDPMGVSVMMEDGAALIGLLIATTCLSLSYFSGNNVYDAIGSILIGILLGNIAMFLIGKNASALLGQSVPVHTREKIIKILEGDPVVSSIHDVKAITLGPNVLRFKAEVEFDGTVIAKKYLTEELVAEMKAAKTDQEVRDILIKYGSVVVSALGDEVDRIEEIIRQQVPDARYVDLEAN